MKKRSFYLVNIIGPLVLGLIVYILYRPEAFISREIYRWIGVSFDISQSGSVANRFIRFYFSDMMWSYALFFTISWILGQGRRAITECFIICFLFEAFLEYGQKIGLLYGTFDIWDIVAEYFAAVISAIIIIHYRGR